MGLLASLLALVFLAAPARAADCDATGVRVLVSQARYAREKAPVFGTFKGVDAAQAKQRCDAEAQKRLESGEEGGWPAPSPLGAKARSSRTCSSWSPRAPRSSATGSTSASSSSRRIQTARTRALSTPSGRSSSAPGISREVGRRKPGPGGVPGMAADLNWSRDQFQLQAGGRAGTGRSRCPPLRSISLKTGGVRCGAGLRHDSHCTPLR